MKNLLNLIGRKISKEQSKDSGLALALIALLLGLLLNDDAYFKTAIVLLFLSMAVPSIFRPFAFLWYGLAELLGTVMSKILLTLVFVIIVLPVALLRKIAGKDSMNLKAFKNGTSTVFTEINKVYSKTDLEKPF